MRKYIFGLVALLLFGCTKHIFKSAWTTEKSPDNFIVRFETSKGSFDVQLTRNYSPLAVDRVYQLVKHHLYDSSLFYRVLPDTIAQFAITDSVIIKDWKMFNVPDEKVILKNTRGTISFARDGKDNRAFGLFINLKDNPKLDTVNVKDVIGYPAFGQVIRGMEVVDSLYSGYGQTTMKELKALYKNRPSFQKTFPKLDFIIKAYILKTK